MTTISDKKRDEMKFLNKVILITGASSGIGAATAIQFAKFGASLSLTGRNLDRLKDISDQCSQNVNIPKPLIQKADLTIEKDVESLLENTIRHFGRLDVLVNNAGILETGSIEDTNLEQFDRIFNINVRSIYYLTHLAVKYLIETKGNIVNVSSVNGIRSFGGVLSYCMSKSAIDQFTRCTALELASKQVRVNSVNPGVTKTEIHKRAGMSDEQYQQFLERSKTTHALGRYGNSEEVAQAICFLASDEASFITGTNLPVDGGRHAMCPR